MNRSNLMLMVEEVLSAQSEQELALILIENPALLKIEILEAMLTIVRNAKQNGEDYFAETLQTAVLRIAKFGMNQPQSVQSHYLPPKPSVEPKVAWAITARRSLALQKNELLTEAIAKAQGQIEIVNFLQAFADGTIEEIDVLSEELIPRLEQSDRREEALTIDLFVFDTRAILAQNYIDYPFEQQKQVRELGIHACQKAVKIAQILDDKPCQSIYLTLLGIGFMKSHKLREAEQYYNAALQVYRDLALKDPHIFNQYVAITLNYLGTLHSKMNRLIEAEKSHDEALQLYRDLALKDPHIFNQDVARTLGNLGYLQLEQVKIERNKLDEAKGSFEYARNLIEDLRAKAITIDDRNRMFQGNITIYNGLLACYIRMGNWREALEIAELGKSRSLSDLLNLKSEDLQPKASTPDTLAIVENLGKKYSDAIKELQQIESYERYLSEQLIKFENDIKRIENNEDGNDDTRQDSLRETVREKQSSEDKKRKSQDKRFAKQSELKSVLEEINKYDKDFPPKAKEIDADGIFEISKNQNRTIVMFRLLRESTAVIFVFPTGELHIEEIKDFGEKEMFELFLDKWLNPYLRWKGRKVGIDVWRNAIEQTLDTVYEKLIIHVHRVLKEKPSSKEVLFVPNQSLALLPLHAASWKDETGERRYLLEEYTISYAPSVSVFKRCQENEKQRSNKTLFVTNPTGNLDSSEKEVEFIQSLHQDNKNLSNENATKSAVIEALRDDYSFAHFSCHGFYNQADPFESGLVMFEDEVIKLSEIINSNLQNNWLTTLSACETGMVDFASPTDEHLGLPLGFIFAGSPSVWASLWSVSDLATSELMQKAYENLSSEEYKNNKLEALRQAQLSMFQKYPHPFNWAGFQHFGV